MLRVTLAPGQLQSAALCPSIGAFVTGSNVGSAKPEHAALWRNTFTLTLGARSPVDGV